MSNTNKKILLVEDEGSLARALQIKLGNEGYKISTAVNGEIALEKLAKDKFDLILLDLVMPKKDGFDFLEEVKEKGLEVPPIVVVSNLSQEEDIERAMSLGVKDYLVKTSLSINEVAERVKKALES